MKILIIIVFTIVYLPLIAQNKYAKLNIDDFENKGLVNFFGDSLLNSYTVFFTGENHIYSEINSELEFKILAYLHQYQNVTHFLFEQSPAVGYIMTKVVIDNNTKNTAFLKDKYFKPFYDLVIKIRDYNSNLDSSKTKIKIHGIDVERFPAFSIFALNDIVKDFSIKGREGFIFETINAIATSNFIDSSPDEIYNDGSVVKNLTGDKINAWETLQTIIDSSKVNSKILKQKLGNNYEIYAQILAGLEKGYQWYHDERNGDLSAPITRERFMLNQFNNVYISNKNDKFYGQFGRCHLNSNKHGSRCYSHNMKSIASRINSDIDSLLTGRVLPIPVYYSHSKIYDNSIIKSLKIKEELLVDKTIYLIDLDYLDENKKINGFNNELKYVIINNHPKGLLTNDYSFEYSIESYHLGLMYGFHFFNKLNGLNFELDAIGVNRFTNKFETYSFTFDYFLVNDLGYHLAYNYIPSVSNGDRFKLRGSTFTYGSNYPLGNKFFIAAFGLNLTYGQMYLIENNDGTVPNLIQSSSKNITVYKNDVFTFDPNIDLRLTLPILSLNARVGYALDVSGKYWKLDGKMKNFNQTSFTSPYIQIGVSLNYKNIK